MQPVFWKAFMFCISVKLQNSENLTSICNKGHSSKEPDAFVSTHRSNGYEIIVGVKNVDEDSMKEE
jgi:hypothetical protein